MGERNNARVLFRNIRIQQPVRTLEPFAIAERTAQRVDPLEDLLQGARFGGMIGSIAGQREARNRAKLEREEFVRQRDRQQQIQDIANQSVTVNAETGRLELDPDNFIAGLLAGGFGQEALQMQRAEDAQAFERTTMLEKIRADVLGARARMLGAEASMLEAQRGPKVTRTLDERAAMGDPVAQQAVEQRDKRRREGRLETQRQLIDISAQQARAQRQEERAFQDQLPVAEGMERTATRTFDTETGQLIDQGMPTRDARQLIKRGRARILNPKQANALGAAQGAIEPVRRLRELMIQIYGQGGIYDNLQAKDRFNAAVRGAFATVFQNDEDFTEANRIIQANVDSIRRAFQGQVGTQTEQDAKRGLQSLPRLTGIPDTKAAAFRSLNNVMNIVNRIFRAYLGNKQFQLEGLESLRPGAQAPRGTLGASEAPSSSADPLGIR